MNESKVSPKKGSIAYFFSKSTTMVEKKNKFEKKKKVVEKKVEKKKAKEAKEKKTKIMKKKKNQLPQPPPGLRIKWQRELLENSPEWAREHVRNLLTVGFCRVQNVFNRSMVDTLLKGGGLEEKQSVVRRVLRERTARQTWKGAKDTIEAHIDQKSNGRVTVLAPACERSHGRYDFPLPEEVIKSLSIVEKLEARPLALVRHMLSSRSRKRNNCEEPPVKKRKPSKRGRIKTQNVMLSKPGSILQPVHTDSDWGKRAKQNPRPHYYTILIALSPHNKHTGGTKLYPGSHRDVSIEPDESKATHLDLNPGDALVFDGLLLHCGMPNLSGTTGHGEERDRFLYYTAISTDRVDANTQVTGV